MITRRKIWLFVLCSVIVLLGIAAGLGWFYQNTGSRLLERAQTAIRANRFDRALDSAGKYIRENPDNWQGYYTQAQAYLASANYVEARESLESAKKRSPKEVSVGLLLAETYRVPARRASGAKDANSLKISIAQYDDANDALCEIQAPEGPRAIDVQVQIGMVAIERASVMEKLAARLEEDALGAEAKRDTATRDSLDKEAKAVRARSADVLAQAKKQLLAAVVLDPSRESAATALVRLCLSRPDDATLAAAKTAILKAKDQPPVATMMLVMQDLQSDRQGPSPLDKQKAADARGVLEGILAKHPDSIPVKLSLADLLVRISELPKAQGLCQEVLKVDARNVRARLLEANILFAQGNLAEAETKLSSLRSQAGSIPDVQFAYARAAMAMGKPEVAREALRAMGKLTSQTDAARLMQAQLALSLGDLPAARQICEEIITNNAGNVGALLLYGNVLARSGDLAGAARTLSALKTACPRWPEAQLAYAQVLAQVGNLPAAEAAAMEAEKIDLGNARALRFLASIRLRQGKVEEGLADARQYYESHKDEPAALGLLVEAAVRSEQVELARKALEEAAAQDGTGPEMLMVVSRGYQMLNDPEAARKAALKAADITPTTSQARMAVARACMSVDRMPQAEKLLAEELQRNPASAAAQYYLGRVSAATRRALPAIDKYRLAVDLDKTNVDYQLVLARALLDSGDLDESARVLDSMSVPTAAAEALRLQIRLIKGQPVDMGKVLEQARGYEQSAMATALPYLASGQLDQCVKFCQAQLAKAPEDVDLRLLMARALLDMGQQKRALEQWGLAIESAPDRMLTYLGMAAVLARSGSADAIEQRMAGLPKARKEFVGIAAGLALAGEGKFDKAAEILRPVSQSTEVTDSIRGRAGLMLAQSLAATGQTDPALAELDRLAATPAFQSSAAIAKAAILIGAKRNQEAEAVLDALTKDAIQQKNIARLQRSVEPFLTMKLYDKALAVCDQLQVLVPGDPRIHQARAVVLRAADRLGEVADCYRKAIELQPQNHQLSIDLAQALDDQHHFEEALAVLRKLEDAGPAAASIALFQQGGLFTRWGLHDQAVKCLLKIAGTRYGDNPKVRMALGQAFALLGKRDPARQSLQAVPQFADEYIPAQVLLARMAEGADAKLAILQALAQAKPGIQGVLIEEMRVLLAARRPAEAVKAYRTFTGSFGMQRVSPETSFMVLRAMLEANDQAGARELALQVAGESKQAPWRILAALLSTEQPQVAAEMLPEADKADPLSTLAALCLTRGDGDAAAQARWLDRLDKIEKQIGKDGPRQLAPDRLLVSVIMGKPEGAKAAMAHIPSIMSLGKGMAAELAATAPTNPKGAQEARSLLKASVALRLGVPRLANTWARQALMARPTCQWAAAIAFRSEADPNARQEIPDLLKPADCALSRLLAAEICQEKRDFAKAAELFAEAARKETGDPSILLSQAICTEYAGKLPQALELYRQVWQASKLPAAANNLAYATLRLHPKDSAKLAEAQALVAEALEKVPRNSTFLDTLGWISYHRGQYEQACVQSRQAVRANPQAPENHYHLAMAESACGHNDLARWHHQAAINIVEAMEKAQRPISPDARQVKDMAEQALKALELGK